MKINGKQLQDSIRILSKNFEMGYILNAVFSQLTTKQLGEVLRYMLNNVKYSKELNEEASLDTGVPVFEEPAKYREFVYAPTGNKYEDFMKNNILDLIAQDKTTDEIRDWLDRNTGIHIN